MKIFLFGSTGMLGNYIKKYLLENEKEVISINRDKLDVTNVSYEKIQEKLSFYNASNGDIIINCIGIIPQSKNVNNANLRNYFIINSIFPNMLATLSELNKMKFIHITTDCVFSGKKGKYNENDLHDENNEYGISKSLGELGYNATIIRTSIIGEELKNKYSLLEWVKKHKNTKLNGYVNHYWNGVTCLELSKIINKMINNNILWKGIRHIFSPKSLSKYELVSIINKVYNLNNEINEYKTDTIVDKTLNTLYDTNDLFNIKDLYLQIDDLNNYKIN